MAKVDEGAAMELELNDERLAVPRRVSRHVAVALRHLAKRREVLMEKRRGLEQEIAEIDAAVEALG